LCGSGWQQPEYGSQLYCVLRWAGIEPLVVWTVRQDKLRINPRMIEHDPEV
jgi:hypothetical protein